MHEGHLLRLFIEGGRGRLSAVSEALDVPRTTLYRIYGDPIVDKEVKEKLTKAGIKIEGVNVSLSSKHKEESNTMKVLPRTVDELLDLHRKHEATQERLIQQQGRELETVYKYVKDLEDKLGIK